MTASPLLIGILILFGIACSLMYAAQRGGLDKRVLAAALVVFPVIGMASPHWHWQGHWQPSLSSTYEIYEVEACVAFQSAASCRKALGATEQIARLNAISQACSQITRGGADYLACEDLTPLWVTPSARVRKNIKWILNSFAAGRGTTGIETP
jgi:hypothetical protein